jgi:hypothetical protein
MARSEVDGDDLALCLHSGYGLDTKTDSGGQATLGEGERGIGCAGEIVGQHAQQALRLVSV